MINKPAKARIPVLAQICKLIPGGLVSKLARKHGLDKQARTFSPWSQVVSLLYAQLTHAFGLNDVCDSLRHHHTMARQYSRSHPACPQHPFPCQQNP